MTLFEDLISMELTARLGWTLLHFTWQATVLAILLALVLRLLQNASAHLRYGAACLVLALIALLPLATFFVAAVPSSNAVSLSPAISAPQAAPLSASPMLDSVAAVRERVAESSISWKQRICQLAEPTLPYVVCAWLIGVAALSLRHLGAWIWLQGLRRRLVSQADPALVDSLNRLSRQLKVSRSVQLVESALVQIPTVIGWLRPVILLPATALTGLTTLQMEAMLAHELAHIRRYDYLSNILQMIAETLGFFHPCVWWISRKIRIERENCCDDLALSVCGDPKSYAQALTEMEKIRCCQAELALAASGGNLVKRISRLLAKDIPHRTQRSWMQAVIAITLLLAVSIPTTLALSNHTNDDPLEMASLPSPETTASTAPTPATKDDRAKVLVECVICEAPVDLKLPGADLTSNAPIAYFESTIKETLQRLRALVPASEELEIIASPQLMTFDGTQTNIAVVEEIPYAAEERSVSSAEEAKPATEFVPIGIQLDVKPIIKEDSTIKLDIEFTFSDVMGWTQRPNDANAQIPVVNRTTCSSQVMVKNQHTIVFGGLSNGRKSDKQTILLIAPQIVHDDTNSATGGQPSSPGAAQDVTYRRTPSGSGSNSSDLTSPISESTPGPVTPLALPGARQDPRVVPVPIPSTEPTETEAGADNAGVLRAKLRIAEHEFAQAEALHKRGDMSRTGVEIARCTLEMTQAEARGDRAAVLRARLRIAELEYAQAEGFYQRGEISKAGCETARLALELAQAEAAASEQSEALILPPSDSVSQSGGETTKESALRNRYSYYYRKSPGTTAEIPSDAGRDDTVNADAAPGRAKDEVRIFALSHIDASKLVPLLSPLLKTLNMSTVGNTQNKLIAIGKPSDMGKLRSLLEELDKPEGLGALPQIPPQNVTRVFELRYAECQYVASLLSQLLSDKDSMKIVAHEPTNRIIVMADPLDHKQIEDLVQIVDRSTDRTSSRYSATQTGPVKSGATRRVASTTTRPSKGAARTELDKAKVSAGTAAKQIQDSDFMPMRQRGGNQTWRRQMVLQQISGLQSELLKQEALRMQLESDISALEQSPQVGMSLQETLKMHQDCVNNDPTIKALADKIAQVEMDLLLARQGLTEKNPGATQKESLLTQLNQRLKVLKQKAKEDADELIAKEARKSRDQQLKKLHVQLKQSRAHEKGLQERLALEKAKLAELDQTQASPNTKNQDLSWHFDAETRAWEPRSVAGSGASE